MNTSTGRGSDIESELSRLNERINDLEYRQALLMERVVQMVREGHLLVSTAPARPSEKDQKSQLLFPNRLPGFD